jgi:hypothetical protein
MSRNEQYKVQDVNGRMGGHCQRWMWMVLDVYGTLRSRITERPNCRLPVATDRYRLILPLRSYALDRSTVTV